MTGLDGSACRAMERLLQERLEELLNAEDSLRLENHLSVCEDCGLVAGALDQVHQLLITEPVAEMPAGLHAQIMASLEGLRRLERLYRRVAIGMLSTAAAVLLLLYQEAAFSIFGVLAAVPSEASEWIPIGSLFTSLSASFSAGMGQISQDGFSFPLALLLLVPVFFAINVMALKNPEVRHA